LLEARAKLVPPDEVKLTGRFYFKMGLKILRKASEKPGEKCKSYKSISKVYTMRV
jgi:hypothetical protein